MVEPISDFVAILLLANLILWVSAYLRRRPSESRRNINRWQ